MRETSKPNHPRNEAVIGKKDNTPPRESGGPIKKLQSLSDACYVGGHKDNPQ